MTSDGRRGITLRPVEATTTRVKTHYSFVLPDKHTQPQHQSLLVIVTAIKQTCPRVGSVGTFSFVFAQFFLAIHTHTQPSAVLTSQSFTHPHIFVSGWSMSMMPLTPTVNLINFMATIFVLIYSLLN